MGALSSAAGVALDRLLGRGAADARRRVVGVAHARGGQFREDGVEGGAGFWGQIPGDRGHAVDVLFADGDATAACRKARRLRLIANDVDWAYGDGPEVTGPGEALIMAMAARPDTLSQLTGPGKALLAQRI